jgi:anti-sigma factor RsiW
MTERDLELLSAYLDSALTSDERAALETRLAQDADLRQELETLRETKALIVGLPQLLAPRNLTLTAAQVGGVSRKSPILLSPWVSVASAAAAFLLFMAGILSLGQAPAAQPQAVNIAVLPSATPTVVVPMTEAAQLAVTSATTTSESIQQAAPMMAVESPTPMGTITLPPMGTAEPPAAMDAARTGDAPPTFTADEAAAMMESAPMGGFTPGSSENMAAGASAPASAPSDVTTMFAEPLASSSLPTQPPPAMTQRPTLTTMPTLVYATVEAPREISAEDVTPTQPFRDPIGVGLIVGGMLLLFVAVVTTLLRMRR